MLILLSLPRIHHLNPSIMPTKGFKEYNNLHFSGITLLLKPTGEIYIPSCTMNGTTCLKSRYFTFIVVSHNPTPKEAKKASNINIGRIKIFHDGAKW